jgi:hypothetical protein
LPGSFEHAGASYESFRNYTEARGEKLRSRAGLGAWGLGLGFGVWGLGFGVRVRVRSGPFVALVFFTPSAFNDLRGEIAVTAILHSESH